MLAEIETALAAHAAADAAFSSTLRGQPGRTRTNDRLAADSKILVSTAFRSRLSASRTDRARRRDSTLWRLIFNDIINDRQAPNAPKPGSMADRGLRGAGGHTATSHPSRSSRSCAGGARAAGLSGCIATA